jgi:hypothetical protein
VHLRFYPITKWFGKSKGKEEQISLGRKESKKEIPTNEPSAEKKLVQVELETKEQWEEISKTIIPTMDVMSMIGRRLGRKTRKRVGNKKSDSVSMERKVFAGMLALQH